jgi:hypothetical protein
MTDREYEAAWAIAASLWPGQAATTAKRVHQAWRRPLERFTADDLFRALEALAERQSRFPALAELVDACREQMQHRLAANPRLTAAPRRTWQEQSVAERVAQFDAELEPGVPMGPFTRRARQLMTGEVQPGEGLAEFFASLPKPKPGSVGEVLRSQAVGESDLAGIVDQFRGGPEQESVGIG